MLRRLAPTCLFAAAATTLAFPAQANLILNGDFEACSGALAPGDGTPLTYCNWTFTNFAGQVAAGGNPGRMARLEDNGDPSSDPTASQTVSGLTIGQTYDLSWDLDRRVTLQGGSGASFGVFLDLQTFADNLYLAEQLTDGWVGHMVSFVATATTHTLIFAGELDARSNGQTTAPGTDTDVSYNIDNVSLVARTATNGTPEPGTLALLALALAAGGAMYRRRRVAAARSSAQCLVPQTPCQ